MSRGQNVWLAMAEVRYLAGYTVQPLSIGGLFGWFVRKIEGPGVPGGSIIYQG